jgi:signal peptidase II
MSEVSPHSSAPKWPFAVALVGVVMDQITKKWAVGRLLNPRDTIEVIPGFFNFSYAENTGAAFSLFDGHPRPLMFFSIIVFGLMVVFRDKLFTRKPIEQAAFGLIMGGVIGNLLDRMRLQYVIDFIHWHWAEKNLHWPVFNIADSLICVGVGLYMLSGLRTSKASAES